ncbi:MAG: HPr(Ser) kinase/phosphatase [Lachnospiraceae bacterium]|nr:HPr(Ser) kinase/phosphatase [Lachnospiraceae bacterium]
MASTVTVARLAKRMNLQNLTEQVDLEHRDIRMPDINRPSLQFTGFWDFFEPARVQIVGKVEYTYLMKMDHEEQVQIEGEFLDKQVPCIIFARNQVPNPEFIDMANEKGVPLLMTEKSTSLITSDIITWLHTVLAPMVSIHGVLVDVYGEGVLITGESGIGKSEAAIELIKRGHRLVSDDVVEIRRVSDNQLIGSAPAITRHFIELRGIGIVDVKTLFGVEAVKTTQQIDLVIQLQDWNKDDEYDRMGMEDDYIEYLGNKVVCHHLPVRPGRNLAIIVEAAAVNHRQKKMGYNAAQALYQRVQDVLGGTLTEDSDEFLF